MKPKLVQAFGRWNVLMPDGSKALSRWTANKNMAEQTLQVALQGGIAPPGWKDPMQERPARAVNVVDLAPLEEELDPEIRGARARALVNDPVFVEALAKHRDDLMRAWAHTEPEAREAREAAYYELRGLNAAVRRLEGFMRDARAEALKRQKAAG